MHKFFLAIAILTLTIVGFAQNQKFEIGIAKQFQPNDTTRTFTISGNQLDDVKIILTKTYGEPKGEGGLVRWDQIQIPGISHKVNLLLHDGVLTEDKICTTLEFTYTEKDKQDAISHLGKNQRRYMNIEVLNTQNKNFITNDQLETLINDYLLQILNKK